MENKTIFECQRDDCNESMQATIPAWINFVDEGLELYGLDQGGEGARFYCREDHPATTEQAEKLAKHIAEKEDRIRYTLLG